MSRSPQQVLDDATFGALEAGWQGPVGSDADHLKTVADLDECLQAGFTTFTIDAGDDVRDTPHPTDPIPWAALEDDAAALRRRYDDLVLDAGAVRITMSADDALAAAAKYGAAIVRTVELYRHLVAAADRPFEVELCLDETGVVTSPEDHVYLATELQRLGVRWNGFAPRFPGAFEKGVEYRGDPDELRASVIAHAALARRFGPYKLSVHSGSDKFGIYPMLARETDAVVHLKTSGTSYLVALEVAAAADPSLFRSIHRVSLAAYRTARASYHVTAGSVPDADALADSALPELVAAPASRQMLHVGYGAVLRNPDGGPSTLATELLTTLDAERDTYRRALADHIGRHLAPFAAAAN